MRAKHIYTAALAVAICFPVFAGSPSPVSCVSFAVPASEWTTTIIITNNCDKPIDLRNAVLTFNTAPAIGGTGNFSGWDFGAGGLDYPSSSTIQRITNNSYSYTYQYAAGSQWWKPNSVLASGATTKISFGNGGGVQKLTVSNMQLYTGDAPVVQYGNIVLNANQALPASAQVVITGAQNTTVPYNSWSNPLSYTVSHMPYGSYTIQASYTLNGSTIAIPVSPGSFTLNSASSNVSLTYTAPAVQPVATFQLPAQPQGQGLQSTINVKATDSTNPAYSVSFTVGWGASKQVTLRAGDTYVFSADSQTGSNAIYNFTFSPAQWLAQANGVNVAVSYNQSPIPTAAVSYSINGLPGAKSGILSFTPVPPTQGNPVNVNFTGSATGKVNLTAGLYSISASNVQDPANKQQYVATIAGTNPITVSTTQPVTPTVGVSYKAQPMSAQVLSAYWAGWSGYQFDLNKDYSDIPLTQLYLAFANYQNGQIDTTVSGYFAKVPAAGSQIWPTYQNWTTYAYNHANVQMIMSLGGASFSQMWSTLKQGNTAIDALAQAIVNTMNTPYPVYRADPNNAQVAFANTQSLLGYVTISGVDLDVELGGARLDSSYTQGLVYLINKIKQLAPNKLVTVATFSVGADPDGACTVSGSAHCGEAIALLQQAGNNIDYVNVMAYDAGQNFVQGASPLYPTAMQNYAKLVGNKAILGLDVQAQWDPIQYFTESDANIIAQAAWAYAHANVTGGTFLWEIGDSSRIPHTLLQSVTATMK